MSYIQFTSNITVKQFLIDNENKNLEEMVQQISNPSRSLYIKSMYDYPGNGRIYYVNPGLANLNIALYKQTGFKQKKWDYLGTFDQAEPIGGFIDSNVANRTPVRYMICSGDETNFTSYLTNYIQSNWDRWSIQDIIYDTANKVYKTTGNIYLFRSNLEAGEINANSNTIKYDSLGRYGRVYKGDLKYESSQLSCLFGDFEVCQDINHSGYLIDKAVANQRQVDEAFVEFNPSVFPNYYLYLHGTDGFKYNKYYQSNGVIWTELQGKYTYFEDKEKLEAWRDFVYNNNLKLLKDCQGNKWIVSITDSISRSIENKSSQYPTRISFTWQEVMDAKTTPIINFLPYAGSRAEE